MGTGYLVVAAMAAIGAIPIKGAEVTVLHDGRIIHRLTTDESGQTASVRLEAPDKALSLDVDYFEAPYSEWDVKVVAPGFVTTIVRNVEVLDTETTILPVNLEPLMENGQEHEIILPPHKQVQPPVERHIEYDTSPIRPAILPEVIVPEFITVHLGRPDQPARNVRVPFAYYVKNSASHEIYATWPHSSLEANIYCIISIALNRIFTEWYRNQGRNFDITNSTQFDQMFVEADVT